MARAKKTRKKILTGDAVYNSRLVTRLINKVMRSGKKTVAERHVYRALDFINKEKELGDGVKALEMAVKNVGPRMEVRSRRVGGAAYQVPVEVRGDRKVHLALKWIIEAARARPNKEYHTFADKLAAEIISSHNQEGEAVRKKDTIHKIADANRAFAHFRW